MSSKYKVSVSSLNVRSGPSTNYSILYTKTMGDIVDVINIIANGSWAQIGTDQYCSMIYLDPYFGSNEIKCSVETNDKNRPIYFLQWDQRWTNKMFSICNNRNQTIGTSGCGPTSASMVINSFADKSYGPVECCDWTVKSGYRTTNSGSSWGMFKSLAVKFNLKFLQTSKFYEAKDFLDKNPNSACVCSMTKGNWTRAGHYILMYKADNTYVYINDPNSTAAHKQKNTKELLSSQCLQYFCFAKPKDGNGESWNPKDNKSAIEKNYVINCSNIVYLCNSPSTKDISNQTFESAEIVHGKFVCGDWIYCVKGLKEGWIPVTYLDEANLNNLNSASALECLDAFGKLKEVGMIDSYDYWMTHIFDIDFLTDLVIKIANFELNEIDSKTYDVNNSNDILKAIDKLVIKGVLNSPDYWKENYKNQPNIKYLIVKAANRI